MSDPMAVLREMNAVVEDHFVFKAGYKHGNLYINKEEFPGIGARNLIKLLGQVVLNAVEDGLEFGAAKEMGVIGPAYGAIPYSLTIAGFLEEYFPKIKFFPARTQLIKLKGRDMHYIPEKLISKYRKKVFVGIEDIVNNGTTCREVKQVFEDQAEADVIAFLSIVNRGEQTADTIGVNGFFPLMDPVLDQHNIKERPCPLCEAGMPINTELGKGGEWVKMFGQPPYPKDMDFSQFWA